MAAEGRCRACAGGASRRDRSGAPEGLGGNEVSYTREFRNSVATTGVNIQGKVGDYALSVAKKRS